MQRPPRPQLSLKMLFFVALDVAGIVLFASGLTWLVREQPLFFRSFPTSTASAVGATIGGLLLMLWAAGQILRQVIQGVARKIDNGR